MVKVTFTKPAFSLSQHIELLKDRGLRIDDEAKTSERLRRIGYYRLSAYFLPLQIDGPDKSHHKFKPGATFARVIRLYEFDRKLRLLVFDGLERVEISVRCCIANTMALSYGPHWFLEAGHFSSAFRHQDLLERINRDLGRSDGVIKGEEYIQHYYRKYDAPPYPPSWMLAEALTLGFWSKLYQALSTSRQKEISAHFGRKYDTVESWLHSLTVLRNCCAHHARIWNKAFSAVPVVRDFPGLGVSETRFAAQAAVLFSLLTHFQSDSWWTHRLAALLDEYPEAGVNAMGFMRRWREHPFWKLTAGEVDPGAGI